MPFSYRQRRGIIIKNVSNKPLTIKLRSRAIDLQNGEETYINPLEVKEAQIRDLLQYRNIAIVRPTTEEEEKVFDAEIRRRERES